MIAQEARRRAAVGAVLGAVAVLVPIAFLWGFSVDDAFITARVASNLARGVGHRFNSGGPVVDAVTPLPLPYLIAPFCAGDPLRAYFFTKWLGAISGVVSGALIGRALAREGDRALLALVPFALSTPFAAWCASGMETGLVVLLATLSLASGFSSSLAAGLAAALRPELVPWAVTLTVAKSLPCEKDFRRPALGLAAVLAPPALVAVVREVAFGSPVPLAFHAKPSDAAHGLYYVLGALLWTGAPALVVAPRTLRRLPAEARAIVVAALVHAVALVMAGGDWMALFRLFVPILPGLYLVGGGLLQVAPVLPAAVRFVAASLVSVVLLVSKGPAARGVQARRLAFIDGARPALAGARRVAALDVGWVSLATDADVLDLAGVTDPTVAHLPGGHTSKRLPERFLEHRGADALVLLLAPAALAPSTPNGASISDLTDVSWARAVEARVAREAAELSFVPRAVVPLSGDGERYVVLRVRNGP